MSRLEHESPTMESDLAQGHALLKENHAPQFLHRTVSTLEDRLRETSALANSR